jgi:hypothetical protein
VGLTFIRFHCCHAELGLASRSVLLGEILEQVQDDGSGKFQVSLTSLLAVEGDSLDVSPESGHELKSDHSGDTMFGDPLASKPGRFMPGEDIVEEIL